MSYEANRPDPALGITKATPTEIDTQLAELYLAEQRAEQGVEIATVALRWALGQQQTWKGRRQVWTVSPAETVAAARGRGDAPVVGAAASRTYAELVARFDTAVKAVTDVAAAQAPLEAEYVRRGGWSRFFTVAAGHVHSSMNCSTCNRGRYVTRFGWNADLSGTTEADAVAKLGPKLCTVCFPSAPVEWTVGPVRKTRDEIAAEREAAKAAAMVTDPKLIADVDGSPLKVDGDTLRTVRSAEIKAVDALVWAAYSRHTAAANEANALRHEGHARKIAAALAHKNGTTAADELARLTAKAVKKVRKDISPAVAELAAAVWAAQAAPAVAAPAPDVDEHQDDEPPVNGLRVGYRVQTPAGVGTVVEWDGSEGEVKLDGRRVEYPIDLAAGDVARLVVLSTGELARQEAIAADPPWMEACSVSAPPSIEDGATVAARVFARTQRVDVVEADQRFRMVRARVGHRIVDVHDYRGERLGTITEVGPFIPGGPPRWQTRAVPGRDDFAPVDHCATFADAVEALLTEEPRTGCCGEPVALIDSGAVGHAGEPDCPEPRSIAHNAYGV